MLLGAATLTADRFDPGLHDTWQRVDQLMYDRVAEALNERGSVTLDLDGHLRRTPALVAAAKECSILQGVKRWVSADRRGFEPRWGMARQRPHTPLTRPRVPALRLEALH